MEIHARHSPFRVLHLSSGNLYGGVETLLVTLARYRHLNASMEPHFALAFEGRLSQELRETGVPVHLLGGARASRPWTIWRIRRRLEQLIRKQDFDIVVCHMAWPMAMFGSTAARLGHKLIFWAHDVPDGRHWLDRWARRATPDGVLVNSKFTEMAVPRMYPDTPRRVIYYPVAVKDCSSEAHHRDAVRREFSLSDETTVIIQVSRMQPWKGHHLHLKALSQLKDLAAKWVCWFAGGPQRPEEGEYFRELRQMAAELGIADRVQFLGQRSDVPRLLAGADIFCQPNQNPEPFGIVFIEALGAGLPIIARAIGAAPEIVDDKCGMLAPTDDPLVLSELLKQCIESRELRRTLARSAPERARMLCDPARQLARIEDFMRSVVAPGKAAALGGADGRA